ncbi:MAG: TonB-dependent receptor [Bacteroidetes bacterium]|nr:TonB-dependent receptor [Bacteroidota bacterium]
MRQLLFVILLSVASTALWAQSMITGTILDSLTNQPVFNATIVEIESGKGITTHADGTFQMQVDKLPVTLMVYHVSYLDKRVVVSQSSIGNILLAENPDLLNLVVVSGNKGEKRLKELTMSLEILRPDIVQDKNPIKMDEVINQVPGVQVTDDQVNIRAGSGWSYGAGSRVMVLVDGAPMMNGDAGNVLWSFISSDQVGQLEVLKGASSVLYGSSALNGIISIQTIWPGEKPKTQVTLFPGFYSKAKRSSLHWTSRTLFSSGLRISDSRRLSDKHDLNTSFEYIDDDGYRFGDIEMRLHAGADWRFRVGKDMFVGVRSHLLHTQTGAFLLWKSYDSAYLALDNAVTTTLGTKVRIDPFWVWKTSSNWLHKLNTRYLWVDNNVDSGDPTNDQSNSAGTIYADYQLTTPRRAGIQLTGGALFTRTVSKSPLFGGNRNSRNMAVYAQADWKYRKLSANLGVRYEDYLLNDYHESRPVFRSGINYGLGKATFLRASYGQGYRFPTIAESYIETKVGFVSVFSNPALKSEFGYNTEVGVKQGFKIKKLKGFLDVAVFQMHYEDMMEFTFSQWSKDVSIENGLGLGFKSVNTGPTQISGVDVSISGEWKIHKQHVIRFIGGYTYSDPVSLKPRYVFATDSVGRDLNYINTSSDTTGYQLKYRSKHLYRLDVSYEFGKFQLGCSYQYHSNARNVDRNFVVEPLSIFIPGIAQGVDLNNPGVGLVDVRCFYHLKNDVRVGIVVSNLLNREYMVRPGDLASPQRWMVQLKKTI